MSRLYRPYNLRVMYNVKKLKIFNNYNNNNYYIYVVDDS